jgi:hypothetical protein
MNLSARDMARVCSSASPVIENFSFTEQLSAMKQRISNIDRENVICKSWGLIPAKLILEGAQEFPILNINLKIA